MAERWMERCACGHPWATHDVEEYDGDGSETCCVSGCEQRGCPGRSEAWLNRANAPVVEDDDAWRPASPGDTPGEMIPGEDDDVMPAPIAPLRGRCVGHDQRDILRDPTDGLPFVFCPACDMIPAGGHPVRERGWSRARYEAERRGQGAVE